MARRSRRRRHSPSKANPRSFSELRANGAQEDSPPRAAPAQAEQRESEPPVQSSSGQAKRVQVDWNQEYSRVFTDLKQLLIVSAALFVVMLVVGLFL